MTTEERMARAEALAHDVERHDMATTKPWIAREVSPESSTFQWVRIVGPFVSSDGAWLRHDANVACELRNAAPEVAAVLRGLVHDLRRSEGLAEELATALRARDAEVTRLHAARSELEERLADLRAQVVSALSAAGPCEDERSA